MNILPYAYAGYVFSGPREKKNLERFLIKKMKLIRLME